MGLSQQSCVPCRGGVPPLTPEEARARLAEVPEWTLSDDATRLRRRFTFKGFAQALAFVNRVGDVAEQQGHHPDIAFGWGYAEVTFWTHKIGGLHDNDFIMAARVDELYADG